MSSRWRRISSISSPGRVKTGRYSRQRGRGRGRRPSLASANKAVDKILCGRHMKEVFAVKITADAQKRPGLRYRFDRTAYQQLQRTLLGKTILFTDHANWSDEEVVTAYRGQHHVENAFRQMKDVHYVRFRPAHHWTDQKLRVHAFTSVLALLLCSLLRRELSRKGIEVSLDRMLATLDTIREVRCCSPPDAGAHASSVPTPSSSPSPPRCSRPSISAGSCRVIGAY